VPEHRAVGHELHRASPRGLELPLESELLLHRRDDREDRGDEDRDHARPSRWAR
jgi:hypothetical protein